jgi:hypothetical protein
VNLIYIIKFFFRRLILRVIKFFYQDCVVQNKRILWSSLLDLNNFFFFNTFRCRSLGGVFKNSIGLNSLGSFVINLNKNSSEVNLSFFFKKNRKKVTGTIDVYSGVKIISSLKDFNQNEWHDIFLSLKKSKSIKIYNNTNQDLFFSKHIFKSYDIKNSETKINNIIFLVLDSVDMRTINNSSTLNIIPNIKNFFKKSIIFNNCISTSEWTFPWVHSFLSGFFPSKHNLTDTRHKIDNEINYKKNIIDYLRQNNFYTTGFGTKTLYNNWWGNVNSFDNFYFTDGGYEENINILSASKKIVEILESSKKKNFFLLHMMDTHYPFPQRSISEQYKLGNFRHCYPYKLWTNFESFYDTKAEPKYDDETKNKLKLFTQIRLEEVDRDLSYLFNIIKKKFLKNTVFILSSDHGYSYQDNPRHLLNFQRTNVPLMIHYPNIKNRKLNNLINNSTDINNLIKLISDQKKIRFENKRKYVVSESLYGLRYKASVRDRFFSYHINCFYSSLNNTIDLSNKIYEKIYNFKETKEIYKKNIIKKFRGVLFNHLLKNFNGTILR